MSKIIRFNVHGKFTYEKNWVPCWYPVQSFEVRDGKEMDAWSAAVKYIEDALNNPTVYLVASNGLVDGQFPIPGKLLKAEYRIEEYHESRDIAYEAAKSYD